MPASAHIPAASLRKISPLAVVFLIADNFNYEIDALGLTLWIGNSAGLEERDVGIAILALFQTNRQRSDEHFTQTRCQHASAGAYRGKARSAGAKA